MSYTLNLVKKKCAWMIEFLTFFPQKLLFFLGVKNNTHSFPDFLIIGLPKAATWWLAHLLRSNPLFYLGRNPNGKGEMRYFSKHFEKSLSYYFNVFKNKEGFIRFEKSPDYCIIPTSRIKLIKKLNPEIKIILIFREPIEWSFSHAKMDLLRKNHKNFSEVDFDVFKKHYELNARKYDYEQIFNRWSKFFDHQHLLIISQDKIKNGPSSVLKEVHAFLKVPFEEKFYPDLSPKNTTEKVKLPKEHYEFLEHVNSENIAFYKKKFK